MQTLLSLIEAQARQRPGAVALLDVRRDPLSYVGLVVQVRKMAYCLARLGLKPNDRVAIVLPNGPEMAVSFLAVSAVATSAPLNPGYSRAEFEFFLRDLNAKALITTAGPGTCATQAAEALKVPVLTLTLTHGTQAGSFELAPNTTFSPSDTEVEFATPGDVALVLHTSGTTSKPKIVPLTHRNLACSAQSIARSLELRPHDRCLNIMPLFHVHGLLGALCSSLSAGGSVVCSPGCYATEFFDWMKELEPTWFTAVPTMHQAILAQVTTTAGVPKQHRLRFIRSCSSALSPRLMGDLETAFAVPVIEAYGMTEASHQMASNPLPPGKRKPGSVGIATGLEVAVMDETNRLAPAGETGEIVIRGENVTTGYEGNPAANQKAFTNSWFRTGDQGHLDAEGYLFLTGRLKEIINRGGEKISPREIDEVLLDHPAVAQAVTFAIPDPKLGEEIGAAIVLRDGAVAMPMDIRSFAAARLAHFKVPSRVIFLAEIPKGPTGKLQRIDLARILKLTGEKTGASPRPQFIAPASSVETRLAGIWEQVLGVSRIGLSDSFQQMGGDSLGCTRVVSRIRDAFEVEAPLAAILMAPTLADQVIVVEKALNGRTALTASPKRLLDEVEPPKMEQGYLMSNGAALSFAQARLWFLWQLEPESPAYNRPVFFRLTGPLDAGALERALNDLACRHEVLRATFANGDGQPAQILHPCEPRTLPAGDLSALPAEARGQELERLARAFAREPFDLAGGPVMRARLVRCEPEMHVLLLAFHHIVFDAWSGTILLRDLSRLYEFFSISAKAPARPAANGETPAAPGETCGAPAARSNQYADFASWQRRCFETGAWQADLTYWKEELGGQLPILELPIAMPRPAKQRYEGETVSSEFPAQIIGRLKALCEREQVTMFMLLLAVYKVLLARYTGQEHLIVGCPVAGRTQLETETLIGCFINTLALRTEVRGDMTFLEVLREVRTKAHRAFQHQALPFEKVIEVLNPARLPNRTPVFQTLLNYRNLPAAQPRPSSVHFAPCHFDDGICQFDLSLDVTETEDRLSCRWIFDRDLFRLDDIRLLAGHYHTLLESVLAEPNLHVSRMPMLSASERDQLLAIPKGTNLEHRGERCLHELFAAQAERTPQAVAVVLGERSLSYRELNQRANQVAHYLRSLGVGPETLVAMCMERSLNMLVGMLGILKAGGAYVPLDPAQPKDRLASMLDDFQPAVLLTEESLRFTLPPCVATLVVLDSEWGGFSSQPTHDPVAATTPSNPAYVIYTSGSTGAPNGVVVTHQNVVRLFKNTEAWFDFSSGDVWTLFHSYAFDFSVWEIWGALLYGGRLVIVPYPVSRSASDFYELLAREEVTVLNQTPSAFRQLIQAEATTRTLPGLKLRLVLLGGEPLELRSLQPWFDRHGDQNPSIVNMYGITETTVHVTYRPIRKADLTREHGSVIGFPIPDLQLFLLDENLQPVPTGVPGEICVSGAGVARGYLNRPELTRERFIEHPFSSTSGARLYRSGDRARYNANGELEYVGRLDRQIKLRGFRVELGEVEAALVRHPAVEHAVVAIHEGEPENQRLVAYLVPKPKASLTADQLRGHARSILPEYMVPSAFVTLSSLPLTPNGKIDRKALLAIPQAQFLAGEKFVAPRTATEAALAGIWRRLLGLERLSIHDNFFDLGGHSLLAVRLMWEIQRRFGKVAPLAALFAAPSIVQLARFLDESKNGIAPEPLGGLRGSGNGAPLFHIPGTAGYEFLPEPIARRIGTVRQFYDGLQYPGLDGTRPPASHVKEIAADLISQIQRVCPSGPYCLSGYSFGGVMAFEVARQMEARGLRVERLLLLDTHCPGAVFRKRSLPEFLAALRKHLFAMDYRTRLQWLAKLATNKLAIRHLIVAGRIRSWPRFFRVSNLAPAPTEPPSAAAQVDAAALQAARRYRPGPYSGKVVLFQVEYWDFAYFFRARDPLNGWGRVTHGKLDVITIPGMHEFVLKEPNVSVLAEKIHDSLS